MSKSKTESFSNGDLKKSALSLFDATSHITDDKVAEARHKLGEIIGRVGDEVEEIEEVAAKKAKEVKNYICKHPYQSAGIALGVCAVLGLVLAVRRK